MFQSVSLAAAFPPQTNVCHINQSWKPCDNYSLGCLCNIQSFVYLLNTPVMGMYFLYNNIASLVEFDFLVCHS